MSSLYDLEVRSLDGQPARLSDYRGKVALVVNLASQCGYTPQYAALQSLHEAYRERGLVVLGFPSNDFGAQEPGTPQQIQTFCSRNFGVTFPLFEKVGVVDGPEQSPVYRFLGASGQLPAWNFCKYLIDRQGQPIGYFHSGVTPDSEELRQAVESALR